jgi:hypothetical protein
MAGVTGTQKKGACGNGQGEVQRGSQELVTWGAAGLSKNESGKSTTIIPYPSMLWR